MPLWTILCQIEYPQLNKFSVRETVIFHHDLHIEAVDRKAATAEMHRILRKVIPETFRDLKLTPLEDRPRPYHPIRKSKPRHRVLVTTESE